MAYNLRQASELRRPIPFDGQSNDESNGSDEENYGSNYQNSRAVQRLRRHFLLVEYQTEEGIVIASTVPDPSIEDVAAEESENPSIVPPVSREDARDALDIDGFHARMSKIEEIQRSHDPIGRDVPQTTDRKPAAQRTRIISEMAAAQFDPDFLEPYAIPHIRPQDSHPGLKKHAAAINSIRKDTIAGTPSLAQTISASLQAPPPPQASNIVSISTAEEARQLMEHAYSRTISQQEAHSTATQLWNKHILRCGLRTKPEFLREKATNLPTAMVQLELTKKWRSSVMTEVMLYEKNGVKSGHEPRYNDMKALLSKLLAAEMQLTAGVEGAWHLQAPVAAPQAVQAVPPKAPAKAKTQRYPRPAAPQENFGFSATTTIIPFPRAGGGVKRTADAATDVEGGGESVQDGPQSKKVKTQTGRCGVADTASAILRAGTAMAPSTTAQLATRLVAPTPQRPASTNAGSTPRQPATTTRVASAPRQPATTRVTYTLQRPAPTNAASTPQRFASTNDAQVNTVAHKLRKRILAPAPTPPAASKKKINETAIQVPPGADTTQQRAQDAAAAKPKADIENRAEERTPKILHLAGTARQWSEVAEKEKEKDKKAQG
ncbi:hypothetical protein CC86DRAFT_413514 [Ophiobolus disseminans]|uniref:Uncharacterized protein n=1 Tax=Ophiobolus disseminans TaxID=1469910 RepID=A0A6A6ZDV0_9PLEO|nr:hypothetical protein CC86DRAFT_413514 [Ophiobolus disseminans]